MLVDPAIPRDNTYQVTLVIAGVTYVLDAGALDKSVSKRQFINDDLTENAKYHIRGTLNGAEYYLVYALNDYPIKNLLRAGVLATKASVGKAV